MPDRELQHLIYSRRRRNNRLAAGAVVFLVGIFGFAGFDSSNAPADGDGRPAARQSFLARIRPMKDTLYTNMPSYLELRLDRQRLYRRWRNGSVDTFNVSSGTPRLAKGIETRPGVFLVQSRISWLYSLQFDSTKVFNWLGFNWGIGFHSLEGRGYYRHLGVRPSSHGCVRLAEVDAKKLFETVELGTPVYVHDGSAARIVSFLPDDVPFDTTGMSRRQVLAMYDNRLTDLVRGNRIAHQYPSVPLVLKYVGNTGLPVGSADAVPARQTIPAPLKQFAVSQQALTAAPMRTIRTVAAVAARGDSGKVEQVVLP